MAAKRRWTYGLTQAQGDCRAAQRLDKDVLAFTRFSLRGPHRVEVDAKLVRMALSLGRMSVLRAS